MIADTATNCTVWQNHSFCVQMTLLEVSKARLFKLESTDPQGGKFDITISLCFLKP